MHDEIAFLFELQRVQSTRQIRQHFYHIAEFSESTCLEKKSRIVGQQHLKCNSNNQMTFGVAVPLKPTPTKIIAITIANK